MTRREPLSRPLEFESAGRAVAEQLRSLYRQSIAEQEAREREQTQTEEWVIALREGLFRAVRGFNVETPSQYQMALLDRGDRIVFHTGDHKTLTLIYGEDCVLVESKSQYPSLPMPMSLRVWRAPDGDLRFRAVPDAPVFPSEIMTQTEFMLSVLRMACNRNFNEGMSC
jgi:hypothetical protein